MRPLRKIIDTAAFAHNTRLLAQRAGRARMVWVVKADAYGHGVANLLPVLQEAPMFAVACIEEALALRALGLRQEVLLLEGIFAPDELPVCVGQGFIPCLHEAWQLSVYLGAKQRPPCWLKIDTGMHRLGFLPQDFAGYVRALFADKAMHCQGVMTHFACADEEDLQHARHQLERFQALDIPSGMAKSAANSAALFALPDAHFDWVRPGLALYGMSPFAHHSAEALGLRPVMTLMSEILATRFLAKGESAGYGSYFTAETDGYLATIALGYGDGFARAVQSGSVTVRIGDRTCPIVGRVAMDMSLVWLGSENVAEGRAVTVFGRNHPAEVVAAQADTIPYTLTTMLTPRVHAVVVGKTE